MVFIELKPDDNKIIIGRKNIWQYGFSILAMLKKFGFVDVYVKMNQLDKWKDLKHRLVSIADVKVVREENKKLKDEDSNEDFRIIRLE